MVGLLPDHVSYYPHMLAPGQKQRLGLARALILRPKVIIADEALASLDMSMRSQLINLMLELQEKQGISYIYVTQHIGMMKHISDQVLVMHQGEVVERGSTADVLASPLHELTRRLIAGHFGEALTADAWRRIAKRNKYPQFDSLRVFMRLPNSNVSTSSNATEGNNVPWVAQMPAVFNTGK